MEKFSAHYQIDIEFATHSQIEISKILAQIAAVQKKQAPQVPAFSIRCVSHDSL